MTRSIRLSIAPATATTCGDGSGKACPLIVRDDYQSMLRCGAFHGYANLEYVGTTRDGGLLRWPECIEAEDLAQR